MNAGKKLTWAQASKVAGANHEAVAYVVYNTANGMDFQEACENENLYGDRADIVSDIQLAQRLLSDLGYAVGGTK